VGKTVVDIDGQSFRINGELTYAGRAWRGMRIEGLLINSRMVQGIFDDLNPQTRHLWDYPDGPWDPERNTNEFVAAMPAWRAAGLLSFTINFQGGSPRGYSNEQPWHNSAFTETGELRADYLKRMKKILDAADELGMAPIVGYFYFGQDDRWADEQAVIGAACNATDWLLEQGYRNVMIEIANEMNIRYETPIIRPERCHELIELVQKRSEGKLNTQAGRLLVSSSMGGGAVPPENIIAASDFVLLHGNGVHDPDRLAALVDETRKVPTYRGQPVIVNEDDHYDFDKPKNNFTAAVSRYASWGFFDYRRDGEAFTEGYQSVPCSWRHDDSARKRGFFALLAEMTGGTIV